MDNFRIKRIDGKNVGIQEFVGGKTGWVTRSFHGNSPKSLIRGLLELAMAQHVPEGEPLVKQLENLKLEIEFIERNLGDMIDDFRDK